MKKVLFSSKLYSGSSFLIEKLAYQLMGLKNTKYMLFT